MTLVLEGLRLHAEGAGPAGELRGECRVPLRDLELLAHEEERHGQALRRRGAHAVADAGFGERAAQELGGLRLVPLVSVQPTEEDERFGEIVAPTCRRERLFQQGACSRRVARGEAVAGRRHRPAVSGVRLVERRQPACLLAELRGRRGRASRAGVLRRLLERARDVGVRGVCRERQVAGALVHVWDDLGEAPVELAAPDRVEALVRGRSEQRVCETDTVAFELDHLRVQRRP